MEPMKDITQKELKETLENPIDQAGNKIKLRSVSHGNIVRHLQNIPYKKEPATQIKSVKENVPKETVEWNLTPKQYMDSIVSGQKPINVKEYMIENIKRHSEMVEPEIKVSPEIEVNNQEQAEINVNEPTISSVEQEANVDVEKAYEEINNIRQQILSKKESAEQAQKEANDSDQYVQELGVQYTEAQKQLQEAKTRNKEMKLKLLEALKSQKDTLINETKKYDDVIEEAHKRKEANRNMTAEIEPKISSTQAEATTINNDTARMEEYLNAISSDNVINFVPLNNDSDEKVRRIA